jgi:hypothetical protein
MSLTLSRDSAPRGRTRQVASNLLPLAQLGFERSIRLVHGAALAPT